MKNYSLVFALTMVIALTGCGGKQTSGITVSNATGAATASTTASGTTTTPATTTPVANAPADARVVAAQSIYNFGQLTVGVTSAALSIELRNVGTAAATGMTALVPVPFTLAGSSCPASLPPQASCVVQVQGRPTAVGDLNVQFGIQYGTGQSNPRREFIATLVAGALLPARFVTASVNFGNLYTGNTSGVATVRVTNVGQSVGTPVIDFTNDQGFSIHSRGDCNGTVALAAGASCTFQVKSTLAANRTGNVSARVARVRSPDGGISDSIASVNGVVGPSAPLFLKVRHIAGFQQSYLPTRDPNEAIGAYNLESQLATLFTTPFNSNCSVKLYRGYVVTAPGRLHHMLSHGLEAITYDGPVGYACDTPLAGVATNTLMRCFYNNGAGGIWRDSINSCPAGFTFQGVLGYVP